MARRFMCKCGARIEVEADDDDGAIAALQEKGWFACKQGNSLIFECPDCDAKTDGLVERQGW